MEIYIQLSIFCLGLLRSSAVYIPVPSITAGVLSDLRADTLSRSSSLLQNGSQYIQSFTDPSTSSFDFDFSNHSDVGQLLNSTVSSEGDSNLLSLTTEHVGDLNSTIIDGASRIKRNSDADGCISERRPLCQTVTEMVNYRHQIPSVMMHTKCRRDGEAPDLLVGTSLLECRDIYANVPVHVGCRGISVTSCRRRQSRAVKVGCAPFLPCVRLA